MFAYVLLKNILKMDIGETNCYQIAETKFFYVENWCDENGKLYTILELNDGEEVDDVYILNEVLEIVTVDYKNKEEIKKAIRHLLRCYRQMYR